MCANGYPNDVRCLCVTKTPCQKPDLLVRILLEVIGRTQLRVRAGKIADLLCRQFSDSSGAFQPEGLPIIIPSQSADRIEALVRTRLPYAAIQKEALRFAAISSRIVDLDTTSNLRDFARICRAIANVDDKPAPITYVKKLQLIKYHEFEADPLAPRSEIRLVRKKLQVLDQSFPRLFP